VAGLDGEIEITVKGLEDPISDRRNADAYSGYEPLTRGSVWTGTGPVPANFGPNAAGSSTNIEALNLHTSQS
jgi:hypothetical protein